MGDSFLRLQIKRHGPRPLAEEALALEETGNMGIRLIATDLDGTLLDDKKRVPERNIQALRECVARGIVIVPATGRTVRGIPDMIRELPGVRYVITTNGAVVADLEENRIIDSCRLTMEKAVEIMELAADSADEIMYDAYINGDGFTMECFLSNIRYYVKTEGMEELVRKTRQVVPDTIQYVKDQAKEVDKINFFFVDMNAKERMRETLKDVEGILVTSSIPNNLEINAAGADKGGALLRLASYLNMEPAETMAFGDGENDLSMMEKAGVGIAMENGEKSVKKAADYVTLTNEEAGVAAAIEKFILK